MGVAEPAKEENRPWIEEVTGSDGKLKPTGRYVQVIWVDLKDWYKPECVYHYDRKHVNSNPKKSVGGQTLQEMIDLKYTPCAECFPAGYESSCAPVCQV